MWRSFRWSVPLCVASAVLAVAGGSQAANGSIGGTLHSSAITVHYSGRFETQWPTSSSTTSPKGIPGDFARAELEWKAVGEITYAQLNQRTLVHWHYLQLFGTYDYTLIPNGGTPGLKCREVLHEVPGYEKTVEDQLNLSYLSYDKKYEVYASTPFNNRAVTTGLDPSNRCAAFAYWPEPDSNDSKANAFGAAFMPSFAVARGKSLTKKWPTITWTSKTQNAYDEVTATLTISAAR